MTHPCPAPRCHLQQVGDDYVFCFDHARRLDSAVSLALARAHDRTRPLDQQSVVFYENFRIAMLSLGAKPEEIGLRRALLDDAPVLFSQERLAQCLDRELRYREKVFAPGRRPKGMSEAEAQKEIAMMRQIRDKGFTPP